MIHFEELWNNCEELGDPQMPSNLVIKQLEVKFSLFKALLSSKQDMVKEDYDIAISRLFGELLFSLTQLSLTENVNVFKSLVESFNFQNIDAVETKNQ